MPRIRSDPRELAIRQQIGAIIGGLQCNYSDLSRMTGIKYRTLMSRVGEKGSIGSMRLCELWAIQDAAKRKGVSYERKEP